MDAHNVAEDQIVRRFPLTLADEASLWYQSMHPFQCIWQELQEMFRTQFFYDMYYKGTVLSCIEIFSL